jgi:hypothetical protein
MLLNNRCACARILPGTPLFVHGGLCSEGLTLGTASTTFLHGFVPFAMPIRRMILGTPTPSNAQISGSPRFHFYRVTFGLHAIAYRRIIQRFPRTRVVGRDG